MGPGLTGMDKILGSIHKAKYNDKIKGIKIHSGNISSGWAQAHEIRKALKEFKNTDKFIYAYSDYMSQIGYYVSSVADSIFMNPMGMIELKGLASEVLFMKISKPIRCQNGSSASWKIQKCSRALFARSYERGKSYKSKVYWLRLGNIEMKWPKAEEWHPPLWMHW